MAFDADELSELLRGLTEKHSVVGASAAVFSDDQLTTAATGLANRNTQVEVTTDTLFQIGSITKVYTATLVMQLVDSGDVELDAPIKRYLSDLRLGDAAATKTITVRQLLSHTSGLEGDHMEDYGRGDDAITRYVESLADLPQLYEPGRMMSYSNAGWMVLGRLIEQVTNTPYHVAFAGRLVEPAGLTDTLLLPEQVILRRAAVGHLPNPKGGGDLIVTPVWALPFALGPAGATPCATASDVLAFARLHLDDGRSRGGTQVLAPGSVKAMQQVQVEMDDKVTLGDAWGLGWILFTWSGKRVIGHDGATLGQGAFLRVVPERGVAVCLLTNGGGGARDLYRDLFTTVLEREAGVAVPAPPQALADASGLDLSKYVGRYARHEHAFNVRQTPDGLRVDAETGGPLAEMTPPMLDMPLRPSSEQVFLLQTPLSASPAAAVFFDFDASGRPGWLHIGVRAHRREP